MLGKVKEILSTPDIVERTTVMGNGRVTVESQGENINRIIIAGPKGEHDLVSTYLRRPNVIEDYTVIKGDQNLCDPIDDTVTLEIAEDPDKGNVISAYHEIGHAVSTYGLSREKRRQSLLSHVKVARGKQDKDAVSSAVKEIAEITFADEYEAWFNALDMFEQELDQTGWDVRTLYRQEELHRHIEDRVDSYQRPLAMSYEGPWLDFDDMAAGFREQLQQKLENLYARV